MEPAPIPHNEEERLKAVHHLNILDTPPEPRFDAITKEATQRFHVPISTISIIDSDREWFKSCQGLNTREGKRDVSFCGHALLNGVLFIIEDTTRDPRFKDNPMVVGPPYIRFYAGMALIDKTTRHPVGVFCIKDTRTRTLGPEDINDFLLLAKRAEGELNRTAA